MNIAQIDAMQNATHELIACAFDEFDATINQFDVRIVVDPYNELMCYAHVFAKTNDRDELNDFARVIDLFCENECFARASFMHDAREYFVGDGDDSLAVRMIAFDHAIIWVRAFNDEGLCMPD